MGGLGDWVGGGPVHPDPHPDCDTDSNSKKAEITLTRGVMQNVIISARFEGLVGKCMLGAMEA